MIVDLKIDALDSHVWQFYEWLPWVDGRLEEVPKDAADRTGWLKRAALVKWYGAGKHGAGRGSFQGSKRELPGP